MENNVIETRLKIGSPSEYLLLVNGLIINVDSIDYIKLVNDNVTKNYKILITNKTNKTLNIPIETKDLEFCKKMMLDVYDKITVKI
jgi:hypothetical protein